MKGKGDDSMRSSERQCRYLEALARSSYGNGTIVLSVIKVHDGYIDWRCGCEVE